MKAYLSFMLALVAPALGEDLKIRGGGGGGGGDGWGNGGGSGTTTEVIYTTSTFVLCFIPSDQI